VPGRQLVGQRRSAAGPIESAIPARGGRGRRGDGSRSHLAITECPMPPAPGNLCKPGDSDTPWAPRRAVAEIETEILGVPDRPTRTEGGRYGRPKARPGRPATGGPIGKRRSRRGRSTPNWPESWRSSEGWRQPDMGCGGTPTTPRSPVESRPAESTRRSGRSTSAAGCGSIRPSRSERPRCPGTGGFHLHPDGDDGREQVVTRG